MLFCRIKLYTSRSDWGGYSLRFCITVVFVFVDNIMINTGLARVYHWTIVDALWECWRSVTSSLIKVDKSLRIFTLTHINHDITIIKTWFSLYIFFLLDYTTTPPPTTTITNTKGKNRKYTKTLEPVFYIEYNDLIWSFKRLWDRNERLYLIPKNKRHKSIGIFLK